MNYTLNASYTLAPPIGDHHVAVNVAYYFLGAIGMLMVCSLLFFVGIRKNGPCYLGLSWGCLKLWHVCCCCCRRSQSRIRERAEELHNLVSAAELDSDNE